MSYTLTHALAALRNQFPQWKITHCTSNNKITAVKTTDKGQRIRFKTKNFYAIVGAIAKVEGLKPIIKKPNE
jgi:hypothetical protein